MVTQHRKKHILIISQYFWPENFRVNRLAIELSQAGHNVEVLTSIPNYPTGLVFEDYKNDPLSFSKFKGIPVTRVFQFSRKSNKISLLLNYITFLSFSCFYIIKNRRKLKYDIILGIQLSPITSVIPAVLLSKLKNIPLYLWVLDIWPDSVLNYTPLKHSFIFKILENLCGKIYRSAEVLFLSSRGFEQRLKELNVQDNKLEYLPQWIEINGTIDQKKKINLKNNVKNILNPYSDKKIFLFTGNVGEAQDLKKVINGFLKSNRLDDIAFLIIGDGRYKKSIESFLLENGINEQVCCLGYYPSEYMQYFYQLSDFLVISLQDKHIYALTLPGKIQNYMQSGKPIIGMISGEASNIIREANCGFCAPAGNEEEFAYLVNTCLSLEEDDIEKLGENGRKYSEQHFSINHCLNTLEKYL